MLFLPRTPFLNHQSSKPESFSCSPVWDLFQRSPLHSFLVIFFFWKPKSSNLKIFRYDWQRQLNIVVFSLYLGFGVDFHDILPVFLPPTLIRMWSAFDYDVLRISLGHQTTVLDQNRLLRMGPIFGDFVETADHKRAVSTVLESCSYCRRTNTVDVASTLGRTEKVFTIMIHAANLKFVFCTRIREEIS